MESRARRPAPVGLTANLARSVRARLSDDLRHRRSCGPRLGGAHGVGALPGVEPADPADTRPPAARRADRPTARAPWSSSDEPDGDHRGSATGRAFDVAGARAGAVALRGLPALRDRARRAVADPRD